MSRPPRHLHKYFSLADDKRRSWLREAIQDSTLYCSSPLDFNDPFESRFLVDVSDDPTVIREALADPEFRQTIGLPPSGELPPELAASLLAHAKEQVGPYPEALRTKLLSELSVCCFSRGATHPLLWAHYASGHRGVCLRFQTDVDPDFFRHVHQVTYQSPFPRVSLISGASDREGAAVALTKAGHWRYEAEWRALLVDIAPGRQSIKPEALKGVILGWRTHPDDKALISSWLAARKPRPKLLQIVGRPDRYSLSIERIKGST